MKRYLRRTENELLKGLEKQSDEEPVWWNLFRPADSINIDEFILEMVVQVKGGYWIFQMPFHEQNF